MNIKLPQFLGQAVAHSPAGNKRRTLVSCRAAPWSLTETQVARVPSRPSDVASTSRCCHPTRQERAPLHKRCRLGLSRSRLSSDFGVTPRRAMRSARIHPAIQGILASGPGTEVDRNRNAEHRYGPSTGSLSCARTRMREQVAKRRVRELCSQNRI